ncbi:hypothetical protein BA190_27650 [Labrys sp. WJW]|uniref:phage Gp37/Gp68 family protein n=1 Tax=Labrys sp. WJW TaxID=1737983 RepID=UPI00082D0C60|nr:phage Gp37/Gp68 family protein [Labrys sp. WJW]OCC01739.1 hypothetical protein BA190_27650 [Labrys sp. WJW]
MAENTKIEWADHTFNPWLGCTALSPACDHCYAEGWARRAGKPELWEGERRRTSASNWQQPLKWNRQAEAEGRRFRVFCASLADVFDNQVPSRWRDDLWHWIEMTPHLDWLLLTKRPQNIAKMLPTADIGCRPWGDGWSNVWLGTTAEDGERYRRNWPALAKVPARTRFVSYEPALGPLGQLCIDGQVPDWIICGGESGPNARPMHPDWARRVRDDCEIMGIPFLFKQWGEFLPQDMRDATGFEWVLGHSDPRVHDWPDGTGSLRLGKKRAGRSLDGIQHDGFPVAA